MSSLWTPLLLALSLVQPVLFVVGFVIVLRSDRAHGMPRNLLLLAVALQIGVAVLMLLSSVLFESVVILDSLNAIEVFYVVRLGVSKFGSVVSSILIALALGMQIWRKPAESLPE